MQKNTAPSKDNNFNLIRMLAALLVLVSHSFPLSTGHIESEPLRQSFGLTWGSIALDTFFFTSGYLVTASLLSRGNLSSFIFARAIRIVPGLVFVVCSTVVVCGIFFTSLPILDYFLNPQVWRYLIKNILIFGGMEWVLPGVFENTPTATKGTGGGFANGSLWSLAVEVKMYAILAIIFAICRWNERRGQTLKTGATVSKVLSLLGLITFSYSLFANIDHREGANSGLLSMFFVGAALYCQREYVQLRWPLMITALLALLMAAVLGSARVFGVVYVVTLPYIILSTAIVPGGFIRRFNRLGDYSYGTYLFAFPIQQIIATLMGGITPWRMTTLAIPSVLLVAVFSWHCIEKPMLDRKESITQYFKKHLRIKE